MKNFINAIYNETILNNKWKEILLNDYLIEYWRKKIYILDVKYIDWIFETNAKYSLISINNDNIKIFLEKFITNFKNYRWDKIYCFYNNELYFLEYQKTKEWYLYNLTNTWYWFYNIIK